MRRAMDATSYKGKIEKIIYSNPDTSYVVGILAVDSHTTFVFCGVLPLYEQGEMVTLWGEWADHPKFGTQFKVKESAHHMPTDVTEISVFLRSKVIRGVGERFAELIAQHFKEETLDILANEPERLTEIDGIGPKKLAKIVESFQTYQEYRENIVFFQEMGVGASLAIKIQQALGEGAMDLVRHNPYLLVEAVNGIGFKRADEIAARLGFAKDSDVRIQGCIQHCLGQEQKNGHVFTEYHCLIAKVLELVKNESNNEDIAESVENEFRFMIMKQRIQLVEASDGRKAVYSNLAYYSEVSVAERLFELMLESRVLDLPKQVLLQQNIPLASTQDEMIKCLLEQYESRTGIILDSLQRRAIGMALKEGVFIITGGPGTGKTTIIKALVELFEMAGKSVALAAPTGRAAKRMADATGHEAKTIHRLLEFNGKMFVKNSTNQLEENVLIVDEYSMVDIFLSHHLLQALPMGATLIVVGDKDQLPSVGAGTVLRDMINSNVIPVVQLSTIYRQDEHSMIAYNAARINKGKMPEWHSAGDFFFISKSNTDIMNEIVGLVAKRLPEKYGWHPKKDIQLLSPMYRGRSGVNKCNEILREILNPSGLENPDYMVGERPFRIGDKVMQTTNNYDMSWKIPNVEEGKGVFNGDIATVTKIDRESGMIEMTFDDERVANYQHVDMQDITYAYAITIHKSQGSEFPCVILPIEENFFANRNLIYTAITRAKSLVVMVGSKRALANMLSRSDTVSRRSLLQERLQNIFEKVECDD